MRPRRAPGRGPVVSTPAVADRAGDRAGGSGGVRIGPARAWARIGRAVAGRSTWVWLAVVAGAAVLTRLPLMGLPLDPDEGGYAYIARQWAMGVPLYSGAAWVDRPPGLMLAFRWITDLSYTPGALRAGAMAAAVAVALGAACCARILAGPRAGLVAGLLAAVVLAGPYLQGYELNGELLASAVGTCAVAVALWWRAHRRAAGWLVLAAALAGAALLVKQSAVDTLVAVLAIAVAGAPTGRRARLAAVAALGAAAPLAVAAGWAAATGWNRAWYAVVGFQGDLAGTQSAGDRLSAVASSLRHVAPDLAAVALAAAVAVVVLVRRRRWLWPVPLWLAVAVLAAMASPFGHPHYWVQTVAPLCVLASAAVSGEALPPSWLRRLAVLTVTVALAVPLLGQGVVLAHPPLARPELLTGDRRAATDADIGAWLRAHDPPGATVYAFVGAAELYLVARRDSAYPYLWYAAIQRVPGAVPLLVHVLSSPAGPRYVVLYQSPDAVDPTGQLATVLREGFVTAATVDGYVILQRGAPPLVGSSTSSAR